MLRPPARPSLARSGRLGVALAAMTFALGLFRAGSVVAEDARLGSLSRLLTDLSMPHFGSTALLVAPDSGLQRLTLAFADQAFHLGWAELNSGWLLTLAESQLAAVASSGVFDLSEELADELQAIRREVSTIVEGRRRCYVEEVEGRFLFHNFRRTASGAPKRVVL